MEIIVAFGEAYIGRIYVEVKQFSQKARFLYDTQLTAT